MLGYDTVSENPDDIQYYKTKVIIREMISKLEDVAFMPSPPDYAKTKIEEVISVLHDMLR